MIAGRDREVRRWLRPLSEKPAPAACIVAEGATVGWVDYDDDQPWLEPGEVDIGYVIFAAHRRRGLGSRAVQLLAQRHEGFWAPMATLKDQHWLESLHASSTAPWELWGNHRALDLEPLVTLSG